jgi:hypothetical protein
MTDGMKSHFWYVTGSALIQIVAEVSVVRVKMLRVILGPSNGISMSLSSHRLH